MVTINGKSNAFYNCNHIHTEISDANPKRYSVEIPLRDGDLDLTDLMSSMVFFENREIEIGLELRAERQYWPEIHSQLMHDFNGKEVEVVFDEDMLWLWRGHAVVSAIDDHGSTCGITITVNANPFKRKRALRRVFSGTISGDQTVTFNVYGDRGWLTITTDAANYTITYDGETWTLPEGASSAFGLVLPSGNSTITLHGSGDVTVDLEEGIL